MSLLSLSPDLQETVLFLPPTRRGRDPIALADLLALARLLSWKDQRRFWKARALMKSDLRGVLVGADRNARVAPDGSIVWSLTRLTVSAGLSWTSPS